MNQTSKAAKAGRPAGSRAQRAATGQEPESDLPSSEQGALRRGLAILDSLAATERPLTLAEISQQVGLTASTTHRLLQQLGESGRVLRLASGFILSPRSASPLSLYHPMSKLRRNASEVLRNLQTTYGPSASMTIVMGTERMVVELASGDDGFVPYFDTHLRTPLHASASGKMLLSSLAWPQASALLGPAPYPRLTASTIVDEAPLREDLERTAERGYATNFDEYCDGISAVGSPIVLPDGGLFGSIILTGRSKYFGKDSLPAMAGAVRSAAQLFSVAYPTVRNVALFVGR
ncbi:IclR family transcriptional regulator [Chelatococcus reniformis]|nr:IclR family transcriptional regulator C-terminal domain-containing protein [Chelatococcus reniformis]